jgi:hypothetical protein
LRRSASSPRTRSTSSRLPVDGLCCSIARIDRLSRPLRRSSRGGIQPLAERVVVSGQISYNRPVLLPKRRMIQMWLLMSSHLGFN